MLKVNADRIALVMARDILRADSQSQRNINAVVAREVADFVRVLSEELQKTMDNGIDSSCIINTYKNQLTK